MKTITKISMIVITLGWFPFMWICLYGFKQSPETRMIIFMSGLFICLTGALFSLLGLIGNNSFWLTLKGLDDKIKAYVDAKKAYELAEKRLINSSLELEIEKAKYTKLINDDKYTVSNIQTEEDNTIIHLKTCVWKQDIKKRTIDMFYEISDERDYGNSRRYEHYKTEEEAIKIASMKSNKGNEYDIYWNNQSEVITKVTTIREIVRIIKPEEKK